jgi:hypothetical protein
LNIFFYRVQGEALLATKLELWFSAVLVQSCTARCPNHFFTTLPIHDVHVQTLGMIICCYHFKSTADNEDNNPGHRNCFSAKEKSDPDGANKKCVYKKVNQFSIYSRKDQLY